MALGRGLSELLGEVESAYESNSHTKKAQVEDILVDDIMVNPYQPRKIFDEEKLQELSSSIQHNGLLQPIIVIQNDAGYILVAGERRLRAVKMLNETKIKAIIADIEESKLREYALLENIQRDDLNVLEVAYSYAGLINEYNMTHDELAKIVHKSRSSISNILRLLTLSKYTQQMITLDKISLGHAKLIIGLNETEQKTIVDSIIGQKLSVRETEQLMRGFKEDKKELSSQKTKNKNIDMSSIKNFLNTFEDNNLKIKISNNVIKINIDTQDDVETFLKYFNKNNSN